MTAIIGADPVCEGNRFTVEIAGRKIEGQVASTGGYETFQTIGLGTVVIKDPGMNRLAIKPVTVNNGSGLWNVHAVILTLGTNS